VGQVADVMVARSVGRVPIVERDGHRLLGLVARKDILHMQRGRVQQENRRTSVWTELQAPAKPQAT
jgi:predicted transcriptional regulator